MSIKSLQGRVGRVLAAVMYVCINDFAMKYTTATHALTGGIKKILS